MTTEPYTQQVAERLEGLLAAATPRPWRVDGDAMVTEDAIECDMERVLIADLRYFTVSHGDANAALIVAAVNALPGLLAEITKLRARLDAPELHNFAEAVVLEAAHQRERWGEEHDAGKEPQDWFWLIGYLAGKALHAAKTGDRDKALHHTISTAASLANWHAALNGDNSEMRPGHGEDFAASALQGEPS